MGAVNRQAYVVEGVEMTSAHPGQSIRLSSAFCSIATVCDDFVQSPPLPAAVPLATPVYTALKVSLVFPELKVDPFHCAMRPLNPVAELLAPPLGWPLGCEPRAGAEGVVFALFPAAVPAVFPVAVPAEDVPEEPQAVRRIAPVTVSAATTTIRQVDARMDVTALAGGSEAAGFHRSPERERGALAGSTRVFAEDRESRGLGPELTAIPSATPASSSVFAGRL
jgi:hypothetical protein